MGAQNIYEKLKAAGMSHEGACGTMGNLMAESSLIANNAQNGITKLTDAEYTEKFNSTPGACIFDQIGFGLAQWTLASRKQALSDFANSRGVSVGDEDMQVDFLIHEMRTDFPGLYSFLCQTEDLYAATDRVCREYERPAVNNVLKRYELAQGFDRSLRSTPAAQTSAHPPDQSIMILQTVLVYNGYSTEISGYKSPQFLETLREFVADIGG